MTFRRNAVNVEEPLYYPKTLIMDTRAAMAQFEHDTLGVGLTHKNTLEIVTQIMDLFLNDSPDCLARLSTLPRFDRLYNPSLTQDSSKEAAVKRAVQTLGESLYAWLYNHGAFAGEEFPYFFNQLLGKDIVLSHFPY